MPKTWSHEQFLELTAKAREVGDQTVPGLLRVIEEIRGMNAVIYRFLDGYGIAILRGALGPFDSDKAQGYVQVDYAEPRVILSASHLIEELYRSRQILDRECDELLELVESRLGVPRDDSGE